MHCPKRLILSNTEELHARIEELTERVKELEEALETLQVIRDLLSRCPVLIDLL
jgi:prefoldin subunit 5